MRVLSREEDAGVVEEASQKVRRIWESEQLVFDRHPDATHFRYPYIYGPNQVLPREWPIVRRALDRRPHLILADGGLTLITSCHVENAAHAVMLAVEQIDRSAGRSYNVSDDYLLTPGAGGGDRDGRGRPPDGAGQPADRRRPARALRCCRPTPPTTGWSTPA